MLLLYHKLNEFTTFLFIFFYCTPTTYTNCQDKKDENNLELFSGNTSEKWADSKSFGREYSLKVSCKSHRRLGDNQRDERVNDTISSYENEALVVTHSKQYLEKIPIMYDSFTHKKVPYGNSFQHFFIIF